METVKIKATGTTLTPALTEYVEQKLGRAVLVKVVPEDKIQSVEVEIGKFIKQNHGDVFRAEINLIVDGKDYYVETVAEDLYAAIDMLKDEILQTLNNQKHKQESIWKKGARKIKQMLKRG